MKGQTIAGFPTELIKTFCATGDEVCNTEFIISEAHLSYYTDGDTETGANWTVGLAKGIAGGASVWGGATPAAQVEKILA